MEDLIYWMSYSASQIVLFISTALLLNRNPRLLQQVQAMEFFNAFFSCLVGSLWEILKQSIFLKKLL